MMTTYRLGCVFTLSLIPVVKEVEVAVVLFIESILQVKTSVLLVKKVKASNKGES